MPEFHPPITIADLRQILYSCAKPGLLARCFLWINRLFSGEFREAFREEPEHRQAFKRLVGVIDSMIPEERAAPELIGFDREYRIAQGSGTRPSEVRHVLQMYFVNRRAVCEWEQRGAKET
jgi:signal recognition particle subunit SRP54